MLGTLESFGDGLWYLPKVFEHSIDYRSIKNSYRETPTEWQMLTPNRLMAMPNNKDYTDLNRIGNLLATPVGKATGFENLSLSNIDVFIDLPGHQLSWHFDHNNYRALLQVYTGDSTIVGGGTQWYLGDRNQELYTKYGTDLQVNQAGLEVTETPYEPGAGYINDNTKHKAHGTRAVRPGTVRESVLFAFS